MATIQPILAPVAAALRKTLATAQMPAVRISRPIMLLTSIPMVKRLWLREFAPPYPLGSGAHFRSLPAVPPGHAADAKVQPPSAGAPPLIRVHGDPLFAAGANGHVVMAVTPG